MNKRQIIGVVGPIRSGKTSACEYLRFKYHATICRNSMLLEQVLIGLGLDRSRDNLARLGMALFDTFGRDLLARHWEKVIKSDLGGASIIVIDGLRFPEEIAFYREHTCFTLLAIVADDECRYLRSRSAQDNYKDSMMDSKVFLGQSNIKNESYVDQLVKSGDVVIKNNDTLDDFHDKLDVMIESTYCIKTPSELG